MPVHRFSRRWLLVGAGAAALVGASRVELPARAAAADPAALRDRVAGTVAPYVGYAEASGRLGLPQIPQLESVVGLLTGTTRIRVQVADAEHWRVDELALAGERDTYRNAGVEYRWDFDADQVTRVVGQAAFRLPRAGDLLPPDLARRLLALAPGDPVTALPARRVAGRDVPGFRLTPADPETTVGRVDVWADPATGLALRIEVAPRAGPSLLVSELLEVQDRAPDPAALRLRTPPGAGFVTAQAVDLSGALRVLNPPPPPAALAGRARTELPGGPEAQLPGVGAYGSGLATFVLVPIGRDIADRAIDSAPAGGGSLVTVPGGRAAVVATPLLSVGVRSRGRVGALVVGAVAPDVLKQALLDLPSRGRPR